MKKFILRTILTTLILSSLSALPLYADEIAVPEPAEEVITAVNSQAYAIEAYQLLEHSLKFAYNGYPDHYAGCWLEGDTLCVGVTTDDEGVRSIYLDILAPAKCRIEYRVVKYSYNQLMIFNEVIWSGHAVDPLAEPISLADTCGLNSSGIDTDRNCVEITSEQGYSDELYAALLSFAEDLGADADIFDLEESAVTILPAMEEAAVEEIPAPNPAVELPVGLSMNPLLPYFNQTYGENVYPNHYAGCWHESTAVLPTSSDENEFGEVSMEMSGGLVLHIMLAEKVDRETLAKYRELCMADAAFISDLDFSVVFDYAEYSYNTLRYIKDEVKARYEARVGTEKYLQATIDENDNRVILRCEEYDDALRTVVDELTEEFGKSSALFEVIETEIVIAEPQAGPEEDPIYVVLPQFEVIEESVAEPVCEPPLTYHPVPVFANPMDEYAHENNGYPDYYAGHRYPFGDLVVYVTEDADESDLDEIRAIYGDDVTIETRKYSYNMLLSALEQVLDKADGKVWGGIDAENNCVLIHTFDTIDDIRRMYKEIFVSLDADEDIFDLHASTYPDTTAEWVITESGIPADAAAELLDIWESSLLNPPHDYLGYSKANDNTIIIKAAKNDEETFDKFRSIVSAADCNIEFEIAEHSAVNMAMYRDLLIKQIGHYDKNPYKIYAIGISDDDGGFVYVLREKYIMGDDTTDELAEYIENIMRTHRHFDDCEVRILEYDSSTYSFDHLRNHDSEVYFVTDSLALPAAQPQTSPATYDTATLLCLLFSSLSAAGIIIGKRGR